MEKKQVDGIFKQEIIEKLSPENKKNYERLLSRDREYSVSEFNKNTESSKIHELNRELYDIIRNNNIDSKGRTMDKIMIGIINKITTERNNIIESKSYDYNKKFRLENLKESIDSIVDFLETKQHASYSRSTGVLMSELMSTEFLLKRTLELQKILDNDTKYFESFANAYSNAQRNFIAQEYEYNKKSKLGKLIAKLNGEHQKYVEARGAVTSFESSYLRNPDHNVIEGYPNTEYLFTEAYANPKYEQIIEEEKEGKTK